MEKLSRTNYTNQILELTVELHSQLESLRNNIDINNPPLSAIEEMNHLFRRHYFHMGLLYKLLPSNDQEYDDTDDADERITSVWKQIDAIDQHILSIRFELQINFMRQQNRSKKCKENTRPH